MERKMSDSRVAFSDLVTDVSRKSGRPKSTVKAVLEQTFDSILDIVSTGTDVKIVGFGTFYVKEGYTRRTSALREPGNIVEQQIAPKVNLKFSEAYNRRLVEKLEEK